MPFWPVVLASLIGVPFLLMYTGMGMIFAAAGYAGGPKESHASRIVVGWLVFAWLMAAAFGAFGLVPAWRAWHGGAKDFAGGSRLFVDWLAGVAVAGLAVAAVLRVKAAIRRGGDKPSAPMRVLVWALLVLGFVPWGAIAAWIIWPLVLWPLHGHYAWPDATTGWTHTAEVTAVLVAAMVTETAVRAILKRVGR